MELGKLLVKAQNTAWCQTHFASQASLNVIIFEKPQLQSVSLFLKFVHPCHRPFVFDVLLIQSNLYEAASFQSRDFSLIQTLYLLPVLGGHLY